MDIQNLKYNRDLMKAKSRLEKELNMVNSELEKQQPNCKHIRIILGTEKDFLNRETHHAKCMFCGKTGFDYRANEIDAITYKRPIYHDGSVESDREGRLTDIQNLCIEYVTEKSYLTEECLYELLIKAIMEDEEKNKELEKKLGHRLI